MNHPKPIYFESHVTLEPCADENLNKLNIVAGNYDFRVAKLLMERGVPSTRDSFCTGRSADYSELEARMFKFCDDLRSNGFKLFKAKIEAVVTIVRYGT